MVLAMRKAFATEIAVEPADLTVCRYKQPTWPSDMACRHACLSGLAGLMKILKSFVVRGGNSAVDPSQTGLRVAPW